MNSRLAFAGIRSDIGHRGFGMIFPFMARNTGMLDGEFDMMRHRYNLNGGGGTLGVASR
jgi:hypothetical protein